MGLSGPGGIAVHPHSKKVYVADSGNNCIKILNPDMTFSSSFGSEAVVMDSSVCPMMWLLTALGMCMWLITTITTFKCLQQRDSF